MDDKKLTFRSTAEIDGKMTAGMARLLKQVNENQSKSLNFLKETSKGMDKWIKSEKELNKIQKNESNKLLKEREVLLKNIGRAVDYNVKSYERAEKTAQRYARWQAKGVAKAWGMDPSSVDMNNPFWQQYSNKGTGYFQNRAATNAMAGQDYLASVEQQQGIDRAKYQRGLWNAAQILGGASTAAGVYSSYLTTDLERLRNHASIASFGGNIYDAVTEGDYSTLRAMARFGGNLGGMAGKSRSAASWSQISQGLGGAAQLTGGVSLMVGSGGMGAVAGGGLAMSGGASIFGAIKRGATDEAERDAGAAAENAMKWYDALDPISKKNFAKFAGGAGMIGDLGNLAGGVGSRAFQSIHEKVVAGGLTVQQAMPFYQGLRGAVSQGGAENLIGTVSGSLKNYGMDRQTAMGALVGLSGAQGGSSQAENKLEQILHRAFRAGLKDTAAQGMLATSIAGALNGIGGRAGSFGGISELVAGQAKAFGGEAAGVSIAMQGLGLQGSLFGSGSPIKALGTAQAGNVAAIAKKYNLDAAGTMALVSIEDPSKLASATPSSPIWRAVKNSNPSLTDADVSRMFGEIRSGSVGVASSFMGPAFMNNPEARDIVNAGSFGGTAEGQSAAWAIGSGVLKADASGPYRMGKSGDQQAFDTFQGVDALNKMIPFLKALQETDAATNLAKLAVAGTNMAQALNKMSETQPDTLRDLDLVFATLIARINDVGVAIGKLPSIPGVTTSPAATPPVPAAARPAVPGGGGSALLRGARRR